jgi:hypothetical protein
LDAAFKSVSQTNEEDIPDMIPAQEKKTQITKEERKFEESTESRSRSKSNGSSDSN